jgi:guanosine-diphosphatase
MRRTSVSLPTKQPAHDPHEKPARYRPRNLGFFESVKAVWMSQAQKTRWVKTAAIVFVLVAFFYWASPKGVDIYNEGTQSSAERQITQSFFVPRVLMWPSF